MALTRSSLQALLDVDQPLKKVYELEFEDPTINISKVFNEDSMDSAEDKEINSYGVGPLENVGEGGAVPYDDPRLGYSTIYAYQILNL